MGKRGPQPGFRLKNDTNLFCKWVNACFDNRRFEMLNEICDRYGITVSKLIRVCIDLVGDMPQREFEQIVRLYLFRD